MNQSMGTIISDARKSKNMTQAALAELLHVTDKAVSKWERNICCLGEARNPSHVL